MRWTGAITPNNGVPYRSPFPPQELGGEESSCFIKADNIQLLMTSSLLIPATTEEECRWGPIAVQSPQKWTQHVQREMSNKRVTQNTPWRVFYRWILQTLLQLQRSNRLWCDSCLIFILIKIFLASVKLSATLRWFKVRHDTSDMLQPF